MDARSGPIRRRGAGHAGGTRDFILARHTQCYRPADNLSSLTKVSSGSGAGVC